MPVLSHAFGRQSLSISLIVAGMASFTVLSAGTAHAADIPSITDSDSGAAPFSQMQTRIAEIEAQIAMIEQGTMPSQAPAPETSAPAQPRSEVIQSPDQNLTTDGRSDALAAPDQLPELQMPDRSQAKGLSGPAAPLTAGTKVQQLIATALSKVGEGEAADGTSFYGKWYDKYTKQKGFAAAPWCDMFLAWVAVEHGAQDAMGIYAYTPWHAQWFKKQGRFDRAPQVGDLVFFDWGGSKNISAIDHVGLVTGVNPDGSVSTVEGNISDKVIARTRTMDTIVGFGHPAYSG
ncbi:CHAP domain-containing protein [Planomonospora sp. ID91781]|uniref:CHAP domain-containing protein n=1 Tax=Planomonospora sp. ID91781 TaxID=2738135 RepID=UPI0018C37FFD|nr:CHAP domain-containing protein [Planomonospora sp. ID91781]MBG0823290.1 CHAP domain-containing protein [Planomonospora sp. ID91781]